MKQKAYALKTVLMIALCSLLSCSSSSQSSKVKVEHKGALKNFMMNGDLSAKASLSDFKNEKNLYALGAMENLKGEIQIFDSEPYNSVVDGNELVIDKSFDKNAILLVYATVSKWRNLKIPVTVTSQEELEAFIETSAQENGLDTNEPFPFLIEGVFSSIDWHIIDWKEGDFEMTHEKHKTSGLNGKLANVTATILGFYSQNHKAIFTHHSSDVHMHLKTADGLIAGHVDDLELMGNLVLRLPLKLVD